MADYSGMDRPGLWPLIIGGVCEMKRAGMILEGGGTRGVFTAGVLDYFMEISAQYREPFYKEYTTGHYKRGVE